MSLIPSRTASSYTPKLGLLPRLILMGPRLLENLGLSRDLWAIKISGFFVVGLGHALVYVETSHTSESLY